MTFQNTLEDLLKSIPKFVSKDLEHTGSLLKNAVENSAYDMDKELIEKLLSVDEVKSEFFSEISGHWVFNLRHFVNYIKDKNFLADSYTQYKNKIGLAVKDSYLSQVDEVVLNFPYKDCILEGGQTKEESTRKEIFFNQILAKDEITKLLEPKALSGFERFTKDGLDTSFKAFNRNEEGTITDNLLIKGNNLLAMHSLEQEFAGKVKLIYIDPPYNTGNDSFGYNDKFNRSTWLTFMKNRLEIAKELLTEDGVIFVQCDDGEQAYLKVLMDGVFCNDKDEFISCITVKMSHLSGVKMSHRQKNIPKIKEYILAYAKNKDSLKLNELTSPTNWDSVLNRYTSYRVVDKNEPKEYSLWTRIPLSQAIKENLGDKCSDKEIEKFKIKNAHNIFRTATNSSDAFQNLPKEKTFSALTTSTGLEKFIFNSEEVLFADKFICNGEVVSPLGDLWTDIGINNLHNEGGVKLKNGKKPEKLLHRIIEMTTNPNDIILDYHAGSGTTPAVAHKMGRQWIAVEQMDYIKGLPDTRLKKVLEGEQSGISKSVNWQGGGSFVYCELAEYNQKFITLIKEAKNTDTLLHIWEEMKAKSFMEYNVDIHTLDKEIEGLKALEFSEQQKVLVSLLNENMLYVPLSAMNDETYKLSNEDKKFTNSFYGRG